MGHLACSDHVFMEVVLIFVSRLHWTLCKEDNSTHESFLDISRNERNVDIISGPRAFPPQSELHVFEQIRSPFQDSLIVSESGDDRVLSWWGKMTPVVFMTFSSGFVWSFPPAPFMSWLPACVHPQFGGPVGEIDLHCEEIYENE